MKVLWNLIVIFILTFSCVKKKKDNIIVPEQVTDSLVKQSTWIIEIGEQETKNSSRKIFHDTMFVNLRTVDTTFLYDMRYATTNNFLERAVYECDQCLLRFKTIKQLISANNEFKTLGYKIKFYDCYRPLDVQKQMWEIYPDPRYVANPEKGSNHNRGTAVDITLVDKNGEELPMGTDFDYFGLKAHHSYSNLPENVLYNRRLLKTTMEKHGFWSITSEWWHYNLNKSYKYPVSNFKTNCN